VHFRQDTEGLDLELRYFRDSEGREVDFVVVNRGVPVMMVESKASDSKPDRSLRYLRRRFPDCPAWQISATGQKDFLTPEGIRVCPALAFLKTLV
jgi:predicted AAA+ superfamily ATPase